MARPLEPGADLVSGPVFHCRTPGDVALEHRLERISIFRSRLRPSIARRDFSVMLSRNWRLVRSRNQSSWPTLRLERRAPGHAAIALPHTWDRRHRFAEHGMFE